MVRHAEGQCMAITLKSTTVGISFFPADHDTTSIHVGIEDSIHIVLAIGSLHQISKCYPVVIIADDDKRPILHDGIAVDERIRA